MVWSRLSPFIWGENAPPPEQLPDTTSADWAKEAVTDGIARAKLATGDTIPGASWFVRKWLALPDEAPLSGTYPAWVAGGNRAVDALIAMRLPDAHRTGAFSEPSWLAVNQGISARGAAMSKALLKEVLPSPANVPQDLDPSLPERDALAVALVNPACAACHQLMDPLGISLLHFGKGGAYVQSDRGKDIDSSGSFAPTDGKEIRFADIGELSAGLARSCAGTVGLANAFLRVGIAETGAKLEYNELLAEQQRVQRAFIDGGQTYEALLVAFAQTRVALQ